MFGQFALGQAYLGETMLPGAFGPAGGAGAGMNDRQAAEFADLIERLMVQQQRDRDRVTTGARARPPRFTDPKVPPARTPVEVQLEEVQALAALGLLDLGSLEHV